MLLLATATALFAGAASAVQLARLVPQPLVGRDVYAGGGWGLSTTQCPKSTSLCGSAWCCPDALTCNRIGSANIANLCCPKGTTCLTPLQLTPFCADTTWSLWQSTQTQYPYGWFCCLPGQVGLQTGDCVAGETVVQESLKAKLIAGAPSTSSNAGTSTGPANGVGASSTATRQTGSATGSAASSAATDSGSSSSSSSSGSSSSTKSSAIGIGAIIGIAVAGVAILVLVCGIVCCLCIKNRRMKKKLSHQPYNDQRVIQTPGTPAGAQTQYFTYKYPEPAVSPQPTPSPLPTPVPTGVHQLPAENKSMPAQLDAGAAPRLGDSRMPAQLE